MSTPVTATWRLSFEKLTLGNRTIYYIDFANTIAEAVIKGVEKNLKDHGYVNTKINLVIVFP